VNESLTGRRVVVVGASAGIGRAVAICAVRSGARVALVARRPERLADVVSKAGGGIAVPGDVRDAASCAEAIRKSAESLEGIDALCYSAGMAPLAMLAHTDVAHWQAVFETNVIGAHHAILAALRYLPPSGVLMALASETTLQPRVGLGAYGASKSALRSAMAAWRAEHPGRRFCCVLVGPTAPTEFGDDFDGPLLAAVLEDWARRGLAQEEMLHTDDVGQVLVDTIGMLLRHPQVGVDEFLLRSPSAVMGTASSITSSFVDRVEEVR
jgi:NAD(P)-dependent dehydrogenase (short-subunit alcohol dehydrogenase family)